MLIGVLAHMKYMLADENYVDVLRRQRLADAIDQLGPSTTFLACCECHASIAPIHCKAVARMLTD